jgi:hypothetical protein
MTKIGRIYGIIGQTDIDDETGIVSITVTDPNVSPEILDIVEGINKDLQNLVPVTTIIHEAYEITTTPNDADLDIIANGISLVSGGKILMAHDSTMLEYQSNKDIRGH